MKMLGYSSVVVTILLLPSLVASQSMVLVGGGLSDDNEIVYGKILELSGGKGAKIGLMTMASDDPAAEASRLLNVFNNMYGADAYWIPITQSSGSDDPANVELIRQSSGLFFCGGTRGRVIRALRRGGVDSPAMLAIRDLLKEGKMLAGTSAGMASQSSRTVLITGDTYDCLTFQNYTLETTGGLLTFPGPWVLDAHCSEYGREGRMIRILYDTKDLPGIGIAQGFSVDEEHALVVTDLYTRPMGTVIGTTEGVHFFDVSKMVSNPSNSTDFEGAVMSFYSVDDVIDLTTGEATIASWKTVIKPGDEAYSNAVPSDDIFSTENPREWFSTAKRLADNKNDPKITSYSSRKDPVQYQVVLDRTLTTTYGGISPSGNGSFVYSWQNILVNIRGF